MKIVIIIWFFFHLASSFSILERHIQPTSWDYAELKKVVNPANTNVVNGILRVARGRVFRINNPPANQAAPDLQRSNAFDEDDQDTGNTGNTGNNDDTAIPGNNQARRTTPPPQNPRPTRRSRFNNQPEGNHSH